MRRGAQEATKVRRRGDGAQASPGTTPTGARSGDALPRSRGRRGRAAARDLEAAGTGHG